MLLVGRHLESAVVSFRSARSRWRGVVFGSGATQIVYIVG
jgi:hypothetical protein